jgi:hypothetical protein
MRAYWMICLYYRIALVNESLLDYLSILQDSTSQWEPVGLFLCTATSNGALEGTPTLSPHGEWRLCSDTEWHLVWKGMKICLKKKKKKMRRHHNDFLNRSMSMWQIKKNPFDQSCISCPFEFDQIPCKLSGLSSRLPFTSYMMISIPKSIQNVWKIELMEMAGSFIMWVNNAVLFAKEQSIPILNV